MFSLRGNLCLAKWNSGQCSALLYFLRQFGFVSMFFGPRFAAFFLCLVSSHHWLLSPQNITMMCQRSSRSMSRRVMTTCIEVPVKIYPIEPIQCPAPRRLMMMLFQPSHAQPFCSRRTEFGVTSHSTVVSLKRALKQNWKLPFHIPKPKKSGICCLEQTPKVHEG